MVYWQGTPLDSMSRANVTAIAAHSISELMDLREEARRRKEFDAMSLAFGLGILFTMAAIAFGLML